MDFTNNTNNLNPCFNCDVIPIQYQGWLFIAFVIIAFIAVLYGFYLVSTDLTLGKSK